MGVRRRVEEMTEDGKQLENLNPKEKRKSLFSHLDYAIGLSREKASKEKAKNTERMSWTRILICAVEAYGKLLDGAQLQELEERIQKIEESKAKEGSQIE
jgi:hypothetical protein